MSSSLRLHHLHIPSRIPYTTSLAIQSHILNQYFAHRNHLRTPSTPVPPIPSVPLPALLTFSTHPTYTVGRRHLETNPLSQSQIDYLIAKDTRGNAAAEFHASSRGGLLTYHGPGQLTAYPLIDLRTHGLGARQYVRLLEEVVIATCSHLGVSNVGVSCNDPGVWVLDSDGNVKDKKICALGVQITRGVSSHGIGLNVVDRKIPNSCRTKYTFDHDMRNNQTVDHVTQGFLSWGFGRIVACGLEGKSTTWLSRERRTDGGSQDKKAKRSGWLVEDVAGVLAEELKQALKRHGKVQLDENVETMLDGNVKEDPVLENVITNGIDTVSSLSDRPAHNRRAYDGEPRLRKVKVTFIRRVNFDGNVQNRHEKIERGDHSSTQERRRPGADGDPRLGRAEVKKPVFRKHNTKLDRSEQREVAMSLHSGAFRLIKAKPNNMPNSNSVGLPDTRPKHPNLAEPFPNPCASKSN